MRWMDEQMASLRREILIIENMLGKASLSLEYQTIIKRYLHALQDSYHPLERLRKNLQYEDRTP